MMRPRVHALLRAALCLGVAASPLLGAEAHAVVVVLSSKSGPYQQALAGFQKSFGQGARTYALSDGDPQVPRDAKVIVAIGGKAAVHAYPAGKTLIYCLAPGTRIDPSQYDGRVFEIHTTPDIMLTIAWFKDIQPSLKRLAILWNEESIGDYFDQQKKISEHFGVDMISDRLKSDESLPDHLRALKGAVDAIWLPPDPTIVTAENFATIRDFSAANGIPFYVPSEGLVDQGAVASVSASFEDIGMLAGTFTQAALNGTLSGDGAFPDKVHATLNTAAAKICGLKISPDLRKRADRVVP